MKLDFGLLFLRVSSGLMMIPHGWAKLSGFTTKMSSFPDPLGISSQASLTGTVFAEFFCAILLVLGIKTKWVTIPLIFTMLVAAFVVHASDPWNKKEFPLLYAAIFAALTMTGGGKFSIKE